MDHGALLKRAFDITKRYRMLWLFGILIALTAGGGSSGGSGSQFTFNENDLQRGRWPDRLPADQWGPQIRNWFEQFDPSRYLGLFIACCCLLGILIIISVIVQYVARTALMRSVDRIEAAGSAPSWREGWRLGWSSRAFRLWLLELIVGLAVALAALVLLALAASPLLLLLAQNDAASAVGIIVTVLLELAVILILIAAAIALSVLGQFWAREIALADRSIGVALAEGYAEVRRRLKDLGVMWLLLAGIQVAFMIALIPVILLVLTLAGLLGGGLGYLVYSLADSVPWAVAAGLPLFLLVLAVPLAFVGGLYETFRSSLWTLTYREVVHSDHA